MKKMNVIFKETDLVIKHHGVHLDLKRLQPTAQRLLELLEIFAAARQGFKFNQQIPCEREGKQHFAVVIRLRRDQDTLGTCEGKE